MNKFVASLLIILLFAVVGPFVGTLVVFATSAYPEVVKNDGLHHATLFHGFWLVLFVGYMFGLAFAVVAGAFVAVAGLLFRWNNFLVTIAAALFTTVSGVLLVPMIFQVNAEPSGVTWFFPICLLATFACWYLTRGIVRRTWQSV